MAKRAMTEQEKRAAKSKMIIRSLIGTNGMTIRSIADEINMPVSTLYLRLRNPESMRVEDLCRIMKVVGASADERQDLLKAYGLLV